MNDYDPSKFSESSNNHNFIMALTNNDEIVVAIFTFRTKYYPPNTIISNRNILELATDISRYESWKIILDYCGGDINNVPKGIYQYNYISGAAANKDSRILEYVLNNFKTNNNEFYIAGLNSAITNRNQKTARMILDSQRVSASVGLHSAVVCYPELVSLLLQYNGDLLYINSSGLDVVSFALLRDTAHPLLYTLLPDASNGFHFAIYNNNLESIFLHLSKKDFKYKLLPQPLLCAIQYSNITCLKQVCMLFNDYDIKTPISDMKNFRLGGNENIYNMLVKRPFDEEIYKFVFSLSVSADKNNISNSRTPLSAAVREGSLEKVKFLLDNGCDVNFRTSEGTAGHECIYNCYDNNNLEMMKLLLRYGLDLKIGYPQSQSYVPYRGVSVSQLAKILNKPDPSLL
jgi:hypothetical protein